MYNTDWYNNLSKPFLAPPDWLFAPVWTILYIMIFISLVFYFLNFKSNKGIGYIFFAMQMFLNFLWSPVFFYFQNITLALAVIILLDVFAFLTLRKFYSVSNIAGAFFVPYFVWLIFATYLNIGYVVLN